VLPAAEEAPAEDTKGDIAPAATPAPEESLELGSSAESVEGICVKGTQAPFYLTLF